MQVTLVEAMAIAFSQCHQRRDRDRKLNTLRFVGNSLFRQFLRHTAQPLAVSIAHEKENTHA
ncbi:hypothetical protein [Phormidium sp. CCY1219]|uniref:hypothetical protein n=1 Tax=Phormidium sp. CCY1219 TaxID=2886104 RepID=UPI002D1F077F|nr:hypothetical protein [Phormidium sp. CCY1219]MEB3828882.1 hypothetical protein [Phormidium sp. CCY1219]